MRTQNINLIAIAGLTALLGTGIVAKNTQADMVGLNPAGLSQTSSDVGNDGLFFTPTISVLVTQLGYLSPGVGGDAVGLYNVSNSTLLAGATVTTSDTESGSFYYAAITPVSLTAGTEYAVVGFYTGASGNFDNTASSVGGASGITYNGYEYDYNNSLDLPNNSYATAYFGPNFKFANASPIPEPASVALLGLSGLSLLLLPKPRRKH